MKSAKIESKNQKILTSKARTQILIDALYEDNPKASNPDKITLEINTRNAINLLLNKEACSILYTLLNIKFSNAYELSYKILFIDQRCIERTLKQLLRLNFITTLSNNNSKYSLIKKFWKNLHKHSPYTPDLYIIEDNFLKVVEAYSEFFRDRYVATKSTSRIMERKLQYEEYLSHQKKLNIEKSQKNKQYFDNCKICKTGILKESIRGQNYHQFHIGIVCDHCYKKASHKEIIKWMHPNK